MGDTCPEPIGLRRHTVRLAAHRLEWAGLYAREAARLREAIGDLVADIQHVGSTSVPELPAKPVLDIAVALPGGGDAGPLIKPLEGLGYINRGDAGADGGHLFIKESAPDVRVVHLHAVARDDPQWQGYLGFRDALRRDAGLRARYAELKRSLAEDFQNDRRSYTAGKRAFIEDVLAGESGRP